MVAVRASLALVVAGTLVAGASVPIEKRDVMTVLAPLTTWGTLMSTTYISCASNAACITGLLAVKTCGDTFNAKVDAKTATADDATAAEKCLCTTDTSACITCAAGVQATTPSADFATLTTAFGNQVKACAADSFVMPIPVAAAAGSGAAASSAVVATTAAAASSAPVVAASSAPVVAASSAAAPAVASSKASAAVSAAVSSAAAPAAASATKAASATSVNAVSAFGLGLGALALFAAL
ncbi:hypothetical protein RQP46_007246 [Phenoliferia psychrophenolica]